MVDHDQHAPRKQRNAERRGELAAPRHVLFNRHDRAEYEIAIIPNGKKTYSKVIVDAQTGAVLSTKQFGGARGLAGWVRESLEHKQNKTP